MKRESEATRWNARDPKPGSADAVTAGCTCPVLDNAHGRGRLGLGDRAGWIVAEGCPLHWPARGMQHAD